MPSGGWKIRPGLFAQSSAKLLEWYVGLMPAALHPIGLDLIDCAVRKWSRGCSSAGRAPDLHSGGRRFDPDQLHQLIPGRRQQGALGQGPVAQVVRAHP